MNLIRNQLITSLLLISSAGALAQEDNSPISFEGQWCGKWDDIYKTCFTITKEEEQFSVLYEWEEQKGGGFQKKTLMGKQLNANTINFEGKILIVNLKNPTNATAAGIFQYHSRVASLTRILE